MTAAEAIEMGLSIKSDLWQLPMNDFHYRPQWIPLPQIAELTGIDPSTIRAWCRKGLKHIPGDGIPGKPSKVSLHHFVIWVLHKSRHKTMNGIAGHNWTETELMDIQNTERSKIAKRVQKCRLRKRA